MSRRRPRLMRFVRSLIAVAGATSAMLSVGCGSNRLETGYQYQPLGDTANQRRAYYAGPFSPEAREAALRSDNASGPDNRRPRPGS